MSKVAIGSDEHLPHDVINISALVTRQAGNMAMVLALITIHQMTSGIRIPLRGPPDPDSFLIPDSHNGQNLSRILLPFLQARRKEAPGVPTLSQFCYS